MDLFALFSSAFLSSTLLPGGSEIAIVYLNHKTQHGIWALLLTAATGNTLGGMTSYAVGRFIPDRKLHKPNFKRAAAYIRRYGSVLLLLSWLPIIGDFLCVAAGWMRVSWWISALLIGVGKTLRYAFILIAF